MVYWMMCTHKSRNTVEPMNKLTLERVKPKRVVYLLDGKPQIAEVGGGQERLEVIEVLDWEKDERPSR